MSTSSTKAKQEALKKQIEEAAKASPDMNVPDNSQPADDADDSGEE